MRKKVARFLLLERALTTFPNFERKVNLFKERNFVDLYIRGSISIEVAAKRLNKSMKQSWNILK